VPRPLILYVCDRDDGGHLTHPCRRVQRALREAGIPYKKEFGGEQRPLGLNVKGTRPKMLSKIGTEEIPALVLPDRRVITHTRPILRWIKAQGAEFASD
jgi:glutathione S-transferase